MSAKDRPKAKPDRRPTHTELVEAAMRKATQEATQGPRELRSGRFSVQHPPRKPAPAAE